VRGSLHARQAVVAAARDARVQLPSRWEAAEEVAAILPHHAEQAEEVAAASMGHRVQRHPVVAVAAAAWELRSATPALRLQARETVCLRSRVAGGTASSRR